MQNDALLSIWACGIGLERIVQHLPFEEDRQDKGLCLELLRRRLGMDHSQFAQLLCWSAER